MKKFRFQTFAKYLWDYKEEAPLEILILRVLKYGNFEEIKMLFELYPEETYKIATLQTEELIPKIPLMQHFFTVFILSQKLKRISR